MRTTIVILIIVILALLGIAIGWNLKAENGVIDRILGANDTYVDARYATDVIGTRTGTSTAYTYKATEATTSYITRISGLYNTATYTFKVGTASATAALAMTFMGSNNEDCDTASTTGGKLNPALKQDMDWFDIGLNLLGRTNSETITNATTTFVWNNVSTSTKAITFTDIIYECLRVDVRQASATLFAQLRLR